MMRRQTDGWHVTPLHSNASMPVTDLTWVHRVDWTLNSDWNWCSCWNVLDLCFDFTTLHTRISRRKVLVLVKQYCKSIGICIAILIKNLYWYWYWQYFVKVLLTTLPLFHIYIPPCYYCLLYPPNNSRQWTACLLQRGKFIHSVSHLSLKVWQARKQVEKQQKYS